MVFGLLRFADWPPYHSGSTEFDSSFSRNRPFEFTIGVGQVIKGWDEGVIKMSVGEKAKLIITADYGAMLRTPQDYTLILASWI